MNRMYKYLQEHNYISRNGNKKPLIQQELSKERAEAIACKCENIIREEKQELIDYIKKEQKEKRKLIRYLKKEIEEYDESLEIIEEWLEYEKNNQPTEEHDYDTEDEYDTVKCIKDIYEEILSKIEKR